MKLATAKGAAINARLECIEHRNDEWFTFWASALEFYLDVLGLIEQRLGICSKLSDIDSLILLLYRNPDSRIAADYRRTLEFAKKKLDII